MKAEIYSPENACPTPFTGFHQVVDEPVLTTDGSNGCCGTACEQTAREALDLLIARCGGVVQQLQAFRNALPKHLDSAAWYGFKAVARTTLEDVEQDIERLRQVEGSLIALSTALPRHMNSIAERGLRTLIDHYKFVLSRNWSDPN